MGVSIGYQVDKSRTTWITPGWRSMMHGLLLENGLYGILSREDIPTLLKIGREQCRGNREPPFDYADDTHDAFKSLVRAIRKHGAVTVIFEF